jgi:hypothetical protein
MSDHNRKIHKEEMIITSAGRQATKSEATRTGKELPRKVDVFKLSWFV